VTTPVYMFFLQERKTEQDLQSNWFEFFEAVNSETNNSMGFKVST
jgi:hypothetical protein